MQIYFAQAGRCLMRFFSYFSCGKIFIMQQSLNYKRGLRPFAFVVFNAIRILAHHHLLVQQTYSLIPQLSFQVEVFERLVKM